MSSNGQNCSILSQKVPKLNCISIMMSFLTYITGFFMNFELLPILTDYAN
jgi:Mg2+ and Co2+ transporter CorA